MCVGSFLTLLCVNFGNTQNSSHQITVGGLECLDGDGTRAGCLRLDDGDVAVFQAGSVNVSIVSSGGGGRLEVRNVGTGTAHAGGQVLGSLENIIAGLELRGSLGSSVGVHVLDLGLTKHNVGVRVGHTEDVRLGDHEQVVLALGSDTVHVGHFTQTKLLQSTAALLLGAVLLGAGGASGLSVGFGSTLDVILDIFGDVLNVFGDLLNLDLVSGHL
mmetsp:Transcript_47351/g.119271  ORF Transcript_47351/g.119271 Transcript_47351/m.119271 type:complete len:216 (+) Transcript_47351:35-682(+)